MNDLFYLLSILIGAIFLSAILAVPIINLLYRLKITRRIEVDFSTVIDQRKQKVGTPIMGGLIIVISFLIITVLTNFNGSTKVPLIVVLISAILGGIDDVLNIYGIPRKVKPLTRINKLIRVHANILTRLWYVLTYPWHVYKSFFFILGSNPGKGIQAHEKILINSLAGFAVFYWTVIAAGWASPTTLFFPFGLSIDIGILMLPFVILTVLFMSNAVNLADGMDGLSAGMLMPAFISLMAIAMLQGNMNMALLAATATGGIIAYLYFNIPPARVQMGDVGSLALGTLMAVIALEMRVPFLLLVIGFPFVVELLSSLVQSVARRIIGRRILLMAPLHHHFEMIGWKEEKVVMRFWLLAIFCGVLGVWMYLLY